MNPVKAFVGTFTTTDKNVIQNASESIYNIQINSLHGSTHRPISI